MGVSRTANAEIAVTGAVIPNLQTLETRGGSVGTHTHCWGPRVWLAPSTARRIAGEVTGNAARASNSGVRRRARSGIAEGGEFGGCDPHEIRQPLPVLPAIRVDPQVGLGAGIGVGLVGVAGQGAAAQRRHAPS